MKAVIKIDVPDWQIGKDVKIYQSNEMKYVLSSKVSNEILIVAK